MSKTQVPTPQSPVQSRSPRPPSYRLHKASGQAIVSLSGRDHYLGPHGTSESKHRYDQVVSAWLARNRQPIATERAPLSINEVLIAYVEWARDYYRRPDGTPNEKELWHVRRALRPLREAFGLTPAADFGPRRLAAVRERLVHDGLARSLVNAYTRRIKHVFRLAVAEERIPSSVFHALQALENLKRHHTAAHETEPIKPVADHLVDAVRPFVSRQVWGLIELQRCTGARPGEVVIIRGRDIDMSGSLWEYRPARHKTEHHGHDRVVMLGPKAQGIIREFLKPDLDAYLFSPAEAVVERRAALTASRKTPRSQGNRPGTNKKRKPRKSPGDAYSVASYRRAIHYACSRAFPPPDDLPADEARRWRLDHQWAPNQLRHGFATKVRKQFGLDGAQIALGHSHARVSEIYAEKNQQLAARIAAQIG